MQKIENIIVEKIQEYLKQQQIENIPVSLEIPRNPEHGDLSCNVALIASRKVKKPPRLFAEQLAEAIEDEVSGLESVKVAGPGFVNFAFSRAHYQRLLVDIVQNPQEFGDSDEGNGAKWLFEFVSANPTGPLNVVSARAASVGDTLVRALKKRGYSASSEFYVNDGGRQVKLLGASVRARLKQLEDDAEYAEIPDGGYHGEYVADMAKEWQAEPKDIDSFDDDYTGKWAAEKIRDTQENTLNRFRVKFDRWFRESELYDDKNSKWLFDPVKLGKEGDKSSQCTINRAEQIVRYLESSHLTYVKDGALFFKASEFGDDEDRVVRKKDGNLTYVVPDIAYHLDKFRRGNEVAVDILGPDHHGYIKRMEAALKSLGLPKNFFKVILLQQVNLKRGGKEVKMSKRAGVGITLAELIEEVGVDAARFFFLLRRTSSHLDFDIELARRHTEENPVYYVQYAHARIRSILRQPDAFDPEPDADLSALSEKEEIDVIKCLVKFPWTLEAIVRTLDPHPITIYLMDLAKVFHLFYSRHRVISEDKKLTVARLTLCKGAAGILKEGLRLMGVEAPERM